VQVRQSYGEPHTGQRCRLFQLLYCRSFNPITRGCQNAHLSRLFAQSIAFRQDARTNCGRPGMSIELEVDYRDTGEGDRTRVILRRAGSMASVDTSARIMTPFSIEPTIPCGGGQRQQDYFFFMPPRYLPSTPFPNYGLVFHRSVEAPLPRGRVSAWSLVSEPRPRGSGASGIRY
jgi:hypothetical protein